MATVISGLGHNVVWDETGVLRIPKQRKGADRYGSYEYESGAV